MDNRITVHVKNLFLNLDLKTLHEWITLSSKISGVYALAPVYCGIKFSDNIQEALGQIENAPMIFQSLFLSIDQYSVR